jgi:transcriptional regulator with XRE-family HTH domain
VTGAEFLSALERLHLSRERFARRFGLHPSAVYRWTQGARPVPPWVPSVVAMLVAESMHEPYVDPAKLQPFSWG